MKTAELESQKDRLWDVTEAQSFPLGRSGPYTFQDAYNYGARRNLDGFNTENGKIAVVCIDEGIPGGSHILFELTDEVVPVPLQKFSLVHTAGSGVLSERRHMTIQALRTRQPDVALVTNHDLCGAAEMERSSTGGDSALTVGLQATHNIRAELGSDVAVGTIYNLGRPDEFHVARGVLFDGTYAGYEPSRNPYLPPLFVVSRGFFGKDTGKHDAALAARIGLGGHGFGDRFTEKEPFWFVGFTDNDPRSVPLKVLREELVDVRQEVWRETLEEKQGSAGRIGIDMIYAPRDNNTLLTPRGSWSRRPVTSRG